MHQKFLYHEEHKAYETFIKPVVSNGEIREGNEKKEKKIMAGFQLNASPVAFSLPFFPLRATISLLFTSYTSDYTFPYLYT